MMRSIVVDHVRAKHAHRHGGDIQKVTLSEAIGLAADAQEAELIRVSEALDELVKVDERATRVVEMRYFAGLTETEIAHILGVTERTVRRDWEKARMLLRVALA